MISVQLEFLFVQIEAKLFKGFHRNQQLPSGDVIISFWWKKGLTIIGYNPLFFILLL